MKELQSVGTRATRGLLPHFDELEVDAGTVLARAGRLCTELIVVVDGRLELLGSDGSRSLGAGDAWGWQAMSERGINRATVVAASSARVLLMGHAQFRAVAHLWRPPAVAAPVPSIPVERAS